MKQLDGTRRSSHDAQLTRLNSAHTSAAAAPKSGTHAPHVCTCAISHPSEIRHLSPTSSPNLPFPPSITATPQYKTRSLLPRIAFYFTTSSPLTHRGAVSTSRQRRRKLESMAGTGPEYDYPVTGKDEPIPVVDSEAPVEAGGAGAEPVVGEEAGEMNDKDIAAEEQLEAKEAGEWSEDMASNEPLPGEEVDPDLAERLPSDRG